MADLCIRSHGHHGQSEGRALTYPGVRLRRHGLWQARIYVDGRERFIGSFRTQAEAIAARKAAEIRHRRDD
jgi:hypothetical protein